MKLEGIVSYVIRDKKTHEIKRTETLSNTITFTGARDQVWPDNLAISMQPVNNQPADYFTYILYDCEIGNDIGGTPVRSINVDVDPIYGEFIQRFNAPAQDRTIYSICITPTTSFADASNYVVANAYVNLTTPCIQTTTELLDVIYRLRFINDDGKLSKKGLETIAYQMLQLADPMGYPQFIAGNWTPNIRDYIDINSSATQQFNNNEIISGDIDGYSTLYGRRNWDYFNNTTTNIGRLIGTFTLNYNSIGYEQFHQPARLPSQPFVQTIIPHSSSATRPFYDATNDATGEGKITIDDSSWTNPNFPKMYRIDIDSTGPVGTSTYKFGVRNVLGFEGNNYQDSYNIVPFFYNNNNKIIATGDNDPERLDIEGNTIQEYILDDPRILLISASAIWRLNIFTGARERWGDNFGSFASDNNLPATFITQVEVDTTGNIWVACRDTGLYRISADGLTVDFFDATMFGGTPVLTNNCYGVDIGNGKIWAAFNGGLAYTTDNGASWTTIDDTTSPSFVQAGINADWSTIKFIRADRSSATDDIAIAANISGSSIYAVWWSLSTPTTSIYSEALTTFLINNGNTFNISYTSAATVLRYNRRLIVSDQGTWATMVDSNGKIAFLTHGSTTSTTVVVNSSSSNVSFSANYVGQFTKDKNGNEVILVRNSDAAPTFAYPNGSLVIPQASESQNYTGTASLASADMDRYFVHIGSGIVVSPYTGSSGVGIAIQCLSQRDLPLGGEVGEALLWNFYGWDGAAWVLNNPGSKSTHISNDVLHDGLSVSFDNNGDQFIAGDNYTFTVADGIMIDGTVQFDFQYDIYGAPTEITTEFEPSTVPVSPTLGFVTGSTVELLNSDYLQGWVDLIGPPANNSSAAINTNSTEPLAPSFPAAISARGRSNIAVEGDFNLKFSQDTWAVGDDLQFIAGLIDPSFIGQAFVDDTHITHGIFFDYSTATPTIHVRESGVNVFTWPYTLGPDLPQPDNHNSFCITRRGTEVQYYYRGVLMYTSLTTLAGPRHFEVLISGAGGISFTPSSFTDNKKLVWGRSINDYFTRPGNSTLETGTFDPKFDQIDIDGTRTNILLNGAPVTTILTNSLGTSLSAGEIDINTNTGIIRFSPADAGKTITGTVTYIKGY